MSEALKDVAAERAVLAGVFSLGGEAYADIADIVTTKTFTVGSNQVIWACIDNVLKDAPQGRLDYPSILSSAQSLGLADLFKKEGEERHLRAVMNLPVLPENVRRLAAKIRKLEIARLMDKHLDQAREGLYGVTGEESIDQIMGTVERPIFDFSSLLTGNTNGETVLMGDGAVAYVKHLMDNPREMVGISTGMPRYDRAIGGGIRPNSVDVIAARPKVGKTQLVDNVALHIAINQQIPVLNLDTEMSKEEHLNRICANLAGVAVYDIETGKVSYNPSNKRKVLDAAELLQANKNYYYRCIIGSAFEEVLAAMRRWVTRTVGLDSNGKAKPCVIIYDYLKMMSADFMSKDLKEYQALGFIATAIKNFMGRYGVGCLCFAQLNREGADREDDTVVSGSDRIVHYCTSLSQYKWKSEEERADAQGDARKYTHKLIPIIGRHGEGLEDGDYINVQSQYKMGRIVEGPTRDELAKSGPVVGQSQGIIVDAAEQEPVTFQ